MAPRLRVVLLAGESQAVTECGQTIRGLIGRRIAKRARVPAPDKLMARIGNDTRGVEVVGFDGEHGDIAGVLAAVAGGPGDRLDQGDRGVIEPDVLGDQLAGVGVFAEQVAGVVKDELAEVAAAGIGWLGAARTLGALALAAGPADALAEGIGRVADNDGGGALQAAAGQSVARAVGIGVGAVAGSVAGFVVAARDGADGIEPIAGRGGGIDAGDTVARFLAAVARGIVVPAQGELGQGALRGGIAGLAQAVLTVVAEGPVRRVRGILLLSPARRTRPFCLCSFPFCAFVDLAFNGRYVLQN